MRCLSSAKYTMKADILRQAQTEDETPDEPVYEDESSWVDQQDPLTGEFSRRWSSTPVSDNPDTDSVEANTISLRFVSLGQSEKWGEHYQSMDTAKAWIPASVTLSVRDRLTNIRDGYTGNVIWKEEQITPSAGSDYRATEWDVIGVTPVIDARGQHVENIALLERSQVQGG